MAKSKYDRLKRKATFWVAREKEYKDLYLYESKPIRNEVWNLFVADIGERVKIPPTMFDEVVWENSPVEVDVSYEVKIPKGY